MAGQPNVAKSGARVWRVGFDWSSIESRRGHFDFSSTDQTVTSAATHHINLLPILGLAPKFVRSAAALEAPPVNPAAIAGFAAAVASRYGHHGSFWKQHPNLPYRPIRWWEVWNEPNLKEFWGVRPNPAAYVELLASAKSAIVGADPHARVLSAPLAPVANLVPYLERMYASGLADVGPDAFGLDDYRPTVPRLVNVIQTVHGLLRRLDPGTKIWLTEFGWATGHVDQAVHPRGQARRIHRALYRLAHKRHALGLRGIIYFDWRDSIPAVDHPDTWVYHTGLLNKKGRPKRSLHVFRRTTRHLLQAGR